MKPVSCTPQVRGLRASAKDAATPAKTAAGRATTSKQLAPVSSSDDDEELLRALKTASLSAEPRVRNVLTAPVRC